MDAFLIQLDYTNSTQQLRYGTMLGGDAADTAYAIARVTDDCDLIVGSTSTGSATNTFPTTLGAYDRTWWAGGADAFLSRVNWIDNPTNPLDQLDYSTFLGGSGGTDFAYCVVLDGNNAYVGGSTMSSDFPTTLGAFDTTWNGTATGGTSWGDGFILKLSLPAVLH
jgi:hypothetical protein